MLGSERSLFQNVISFSSTWVGEGTSQGNSGQLGNFFENIRVNCSNQGLQYVGYLYLSSEFNLHVPGTVLFTKRAMLTSRSNRCYRC